jgi:hypothetical protein
MPIASEGALAALIRWHEMSLTHREYIKVPDISTDGWLGRACLLLWVLLAPQGREASGGCSAVKKHMDACNQGFQSSYINEAALGGICTLAVLRAQLSHAMHHSASCGHVH